MAVDNSIALQVQAPNFMSPYQLQQGALSIQDLMQRTQANGMALQQQKLALRDQMALAQLWSNPDNIDRSTGTLNPSRIDPKTLPNPQLYGQIVQKYQNAQYLMSKDALEISKAQRDQQKEQQEVAVGVMEDAHTQYEDDIKNGIPVDVAESNFQKNLREGVEAKKKSGLLPEDLGIPKTTGAQAGERIYTRQQKMEQEKIDIEKSKEERAERESLGADRSKLTEDGKAVYDEFIMAGKMVPKTKRGQIDYDELNRLGEKEPGGAGSGAIVSGQADYKANQAILTDFGKGKAGQQVKSFNVAIDHLDTLGKLSDALKNGDVPTFNKIANEVATQTGKAAPGNFEAAKQIVGDEIVKAITGAGGGVADREKAQSVIDSAKSPEQLAGVIQTYKALMGGQLKGLEEQYKQTGRKDFRTKYLTPDAKEILDKISPQKEEKKSELSENQEKNAKKVTVDGKELEAKKAPNGKYYVQKDGQWFEVTQ